MLSVDTIRALTPVQFAALPASAVAGMSVKQLRSLTARQASGVSVEQLQALSERQQAQLPLAFVNAIPADIKQGWRPTPTG